MIAPAFFVAIAGSTYTVERRAWLRAMARPALVATLAFSVVYLPWPVRNLIEFHAPHPLGGRIDRHSEPVENYAGSWAFLRAISSDWQPMTLLTTCYYDLQCAPQLVQFREADPTLDAYELDQLRKLLALRRTQGHSKQVSDGFQALADRRTRMRPWSVEVALPWSRWTAMWIAPHDELLPSYAPMWRWNLHMKPWSRLLLWASLIAALVVLRQRRLRIAALVLVVTIFFRSAALAWTFYSMPRYLLESLPSAFILIAVGTVALGSSAFSALRRARPRTKSTAGVVSASMKT
jgi:hypothetical protein